MEMGITFWEINAKEYRNIGIIITTKAILNSFLLKLSPKAAIINGTRGRL